MLGLVWFIAILMNLCLIQVQGRPTEREGQALVTLKRATCANKGDTLTLSCTLAVNGTGKAFKKWTLSWQSGEGTPLIENVTNTWQNSSHLTSYLRLNAVWSGEKLFTCVASRIENNTKATSIKATSLVKVKSPGSCSIIGLRYVERPVYNSLQLFWRPAKPLQNVKYSLNICTEPDPEWPSEDQGCPYYKRIHMNSSCFYREKDVYKVPDTKGFTCMTTVTDLSWHVNHRAYISSRVQGDSCEYRCSMEKRFYLSVFRDPFPEPDTTEVVLIPAPVVKLRVFTRAPRQVTVVWSDSPFVQHRERRRYKVRYKCSQDLTWNKTEHLLRPKLTLNSYNFQNYRPYDLCRFCVTARAFQEGGMNSEPLCKDIRLHEEPPSSAPYITCSEEKCHTARYANAGNVTITWTLPPRRDWNGALTELRIYYRNGFENYSKNALDYPLKNIKVPLQNETTNGQTLLTGFLSNHTYWLEMVVCNKEGCSNPGNSLKLTAEDLVTSPTTRDDKATAMPVNKAIILVVGIAAGLLTTYLIYLSYSWVQTQRQMPPKIKLTLREPSGYDVVIDSTKVEYDVLVVTDLSRDVDTRQMNTEKTQLKVDEKETSSSSL